MKGDINQKLPKSVNDLLGLTPETLIKPNEAAVHELDQTIAADEKLHAITHLEIIYAREPKKGFRKTKSTVPGLKITAKG